MSEKVKYTSKVHAKNFVKWAKDKPRVVVISADLTSSTEVDEFRKAYPERFFSAGMAEQNMMGMAGGLAREGFFPFVHTFAVFIYRRAYEQISNSIAYPNVPVRMFGFLPGITTPGGMTHQAIEDIAVMRSLPNMTILQTGDATDVESVLDVAQAVNGPVYVRMIRGEIPRLFPADEPLRFNSARILGSGEELTLLTSGICTEEALRATAALRQRGVSLSHLHVTTLKPFSDPAVLQAINGAKHGVITMENHSIVGGLGTATAEMMAEQGVGKPLVRMGLPDCFAHGASKPYLMRKYGIDALGLVGRVERLLKRPLRISESDLEAVRLATVHSIAKAEAL